MFIYSGKVTKVAVYRAFRIAGPSERNRIEDSFHLEDGLCAGLGDDEVIVMLPGILDELLSGEKPTGDLGLILSAALSEPLFQNMQWVPDFSFLKAFDGNYNFGEAGSLASYILTIAVAYVPVAFVVFAEHLADHKNLSTIINSDLTEDPGLHRTLLGDGVGSFAGAFFGGCPNTTYGESVGCVAITGNASVITITVTAFMAIVAAFIAPFVTFLATIPACVMGGVCMTLYGFIAVSGLKMVQKVDLEDNRNLFVVSVILIAGIGGMALRIGQVTLTSIAVALILGIVLNLILSRKEKAE